MLHLLWLIPFLPLAACTVLCLSGGAWNQRTVAWVNLIGMGLCLLVTFFVSGGFLLAPPDGDVYTQTLWTWMGLEHFIIEIGFHLDPLSAVMTLVISLVGFLIFVYSTEFMDGDEGYNRFFAYMNLFAASMLILVLADNLVLLYLGWEGVGICSYLLIGFWYQNPANGRAARKAFIVTRIGDAAMAIGLFLLYSHLGTLHIQTLMQRVPELWTQDETMVTVAAALLLIGALGKSAQLPLQTWLPDAMAGPTPVSALIHAATMVTAGVYLIARTAVLFEHAPAIMTLVAWIGALTLLIAGCSALTQRDLKRILAYSTISQIGYMFLALGVGAWSAGIFHFMTHAFFKALLFLAAGVVILAMHHEHDIFKMGGLRQKIPVVFWTFLIGAASLSAFPLITSGYFSKDLILWEAWSSEKGGFWLWTIAWIGAFITALYSFRMVFVTFWGDQEHKLEHTEKQKMLVPLIVLAVFSVISGWIELPKTLGGFHAFSHRLESVFPMEGFEHESLGMEILMQLLAAAVTLGGIAIAYLIYVRGTLHVGTFTRHPLGASLQRFWYHGWQFDWLYDLLFVRPYVWIANVNRDDVVDLVPRSIAWYHTYIHYGLCRTQNGRLRWYAMGIALGAVISILIIQVL